MVDLIEVGDDYKAQNCREAIEKTQNAAARERPK
jgi:hypothetical protein